MSPLALGLQWWAFSQFYNYESIKKNLITKEIFNYSKMEGKA